MLKTWRITNALKMCVFVFLLLEASGKSAFCSPLSQKKVTAPAIKTKVSYSPISVCVMAVLVKTIPVSISVAYLTSW